MSKERALAASLIEAEARDEIKKAESLEDKVKAAFAVSRDHWMFTDEDTQFMGGIGAVLIQLEEGTPEHSRYMKSIETLRNITAMLSGVPVNFENFEAPKDPIKFVQLWREGK